MKKNIMMMVLLTMSLFSLNSYAHTDSSGWEIIKGSVAIDNIERYTNKVTQFSGHNTSLIDPKPCTVSITLIRDANNGRDLGVLYSIATDGVTTPSSQTSIFFDSEVKIVQNDGIHYSTPQTPSSSYADHLYIHHDHDQSQKTMFLVFGQKHSFNCLVDPRGE